MKKIIINNLKTAVILFATLFAATSCNDLLNNPLQDKETGEDLTLLLIDPDFFDTKITVSLEDTLGNPFTEKEVFVAFFGEKASNIVDLKGEFNEYYSTTNGNIEVAVDPNIEISESNTFLIVIQAVTEDRSWYTFPIEVELNQEGYADVTIVMYPFEQLKSAQLNPGSEPFDVKFKDEIVSSINGWNISVAKGVYNHDFIYSGRYTYNSYMYYTGTTSGELTASNLTLDDGLIKDYGIATSSYYGFSVSSFNKSLSVSPPPTYTGLSFSLLFDRQDYYSGYIRNNLEKCAEGINFNVEEKYGQKGSAKFDYTLKIRKSGIFYEQYETVAKGKLGGKSLPYHVNTGSFYYPTKVDEYISLNYYDTNKLYLSISGDAQYDVEPSEIEITNFCGTTVDLNVVPKSGLKPYKIITSYVCENNPVGAAPTISGKFRIKGSDERWTPFNFSGGVAVLQLKPNTVYEMVANAFGNDATFDFPTEKSKIGSVVNTALDEINELKNLEINFSEITEASDNDPFIGTEIRIVATFNAGNCPI
ncbi:MAG: hypothetical protein PF541_02290 [Prolixibacteraceae bacterium]|jgi:hypothetical protein|nr:hypothetical protein [Prolixibacteraceae bacterium]